MTPEMDEYVRTHIKPNRVELAASIVCIDLSLRRYSFSDYQPGDGTSYKLTFTRMPEGRGPYWGCDNEGNYVMVGWMDHGCYPFELLTANNYFDPGYIAGKIDPRDNIASGLALSALFKAINAYWRKP